MNRPDNYEVKQALDILLQAEEIRKDSSLLDEVLKYAKNQKAAICSIEDLKAARDQAIEEEGESPDEESKESPEEDKAEGEVDNESPDPMLEENTYQKRVERANNEASAPSEIPMVKVVED